VGSLSSRSASSGRPASDRCHRIRRGGDRARASSHAMRIARPIQLVLEPARRCDALSVRAGTPTTRGGMLELAHRGRLHRRSRTRLAGVDALVSAVSRPTRRCSAHVLAVAPIQNVVDHIGRHRDGAARSAGVLKHPFRPRRTVHPIGGYMAFGSIATSSARDDADPAPDDPYSISETS